MHEAGLMQEMLNVAVRHLEASEATRIVCLRLSVGPLSGVVPEALSFAFEALAPQTPASGARLEIATPPARCFCATCDTTHDLEQLDYSCPACGNDDVALTGGTEFELVSMEVA